MLETYPDKVKIVHKHYPIQGHKFATQAALAALAAQAQGRFWEFSDLLYSNQKVLNNEKISALADEIGLDKQKFDQSIKDPETMANLRNDVKDARDAGVRGTPAVFINGKELKNRSMKGFRRMIDAALK